MFQKGHPDYRKPLNPIKRFFENFDACESNSCWQWKNPDEHSGWYGRFFYQGKLVYAHRVMWKIAYGSIPEGMDVLHKCDNPTCVNPTHLFLGTHDDNMKDMKAKGRGGENRGERNSTTKITEVMAKQIKSDMRSPTIIADELGISRRIIYHIHSGETWRHI